MLLHLASDEKFIDNVITLFDAAAPHSNEYVVITPKGIGPLKYIKKQKSVRVVSDDKEQIRELISGLGNYRGIVVHGLSGPACDIISEAPSCLKVVWLAWGWDIHNIFSFGKELYQPATKELLRSRFGRSFSTRLAKWVKFCLWNAGFVKKRSRIRRKAIHRADFCGTVVPGEWSDVQRLGFRGQFVRFNYDWMENMVPEGADEALAEQCNILVGNSSTPTCNHLEVFHALSGLNLGLAKVIVPLSYGDTSYRGGVVRAGSRLLGKAFVPVLDFMPLAEYNKILRSCGIVVMNHNRQQALGNILASLCLGSCVLLNAESPIYSFMKELKVDVWRFPKDLGKAVAGTLPGRLELASKARRALKAEYSWERGLQRTQELVHKLGCR